MNSFIHFLPLIKFHAYYPDGDEPKSSIHLNYFMNTTSRIYFSLRSRVLFMAYDLKPALHVAKVKKCNRYTRDYPLQA